MNWLCRTNMLSGLKDQEKNKQLKKLRAEKETIMKEHQFNLEAQTAAVAEHSYNATHSFHGQLFVSPSEHVPLMHSLTPPQQMPANTFLTTSPTQPKSSQYPLQFNLARLLQVHPVHLSLLHRLLEFLRASC